MAQRMPVTLVFVAEKVMCSSSTGALQRRSQEQVVSMGLWPWCRCAPSVRLSVRPGYVPCFTSLPLKLFLTGVEKQGPLICALSCVN